jgi:hypothetical protein
VEVNQESGTAEHQHLRPLIDGDVIVYRAGFAADSGRVKWYKENVDGGASEEELKEFLGKEDYLAHALGNTKTCLSEIVGHFNKEQASVFLSGRDNFREAIATILPYKGNRDPLHKPKYYNDIKHYLLGSWAAELVNGMEADDALGMKQYAATDDSTVIVTVDKDLDMIPGWHYNFVKKKLYYIDQQYADTRLFWQMIVGDRTDNIPGIRKMGEVAADRVCYSECGGDVDKIREKVKNLYKEQYGADWEGAYYEVGTLLYIMREERELKTGCPLL